MQAAQMIWVQRILCEGFRAENTLRLWVVLAPPGQDAGTELN